MATSTGSTFQKYLQGTLLSAQKHACIALHTHIHTWLPLRIDLTRGLLFSSVSRWGQNTKGWVHLLSTQWPNKSILLYFYLIASLKERTFFSKLLYNIVSEPEIHLMEKFTYHKHTQRWDTLAFQADRVFQKCWHSLQRDISVAHDTAEQRSAAYKMTGSLQKAKQLQ